MLKDPNNNMLNGRMHHSDTYSICLLAATTGALSISVGSEWPHLHCSTIGSCQSTATSEIVKRAVPV